MTEYAKPPVALDAKIVGSLFTGDNNAISGTIKIDNVEYAMTIDPTPQKSKNDSEYYRFSAARRENGQTSSEPAFSGAMFKTRFFGQIGKGAIRFDSVRFSYPNADGRSALNDFSLVVKPGETVALAMWGNRGATCVRWLEAGGPVTVTLR